MMEGYLLSIDEDEMANYAFSDDTESYDFQFNHESECWELTINFNEKPKLRLIK